MELSRFEIGRAGRVYPRLIERRQGRLPIYCVLLVTADVDINNEFHTVASSPANIA